MFGFRKWFEESLRQEKREQLNKLLVWFADRSSDEHPELNRWDDTKGNENQKWFTLHEIVVETEEDKNQLIAASRYIHDLMEIDTDFMAVNYIAHLYTDPSKIIVRPKAVDTN